jgi:hypothetical protein
MDDKAVSEFSLDRSSGDIVVDLEKNKPYPHHGERHHESVHYGHNNAPTLTIKHSPTTERLTRATSRREALRSDPSARTAAEFRTLSLHVTDTQRGASLPAGKKQVDKAVKGVLKSLAPSFHVWADSILHLQISLLWTFILSLPKKQSKDLARPSSLALMSSSQHEDSKQMASTK